MWDNILSGISSGVDATGGVLNSVLGIANYYNQLDLQKQSWERQDNAVQRRAADLEKAGLNRVLAAGSAAETSAPIALSSPDVRQDSSSELDALIRTIATGQQISQSKADVGLKHAQTRNADLEAVNLAQDLKNKQTEQAYRAMVLQKEKWDLDWYKMNKLPTNSSGVAKDIAQALEMIMNGLTTGKFKGMAGDSLGAIIDSIPNVIDTKSPDFFPGSDKEPFHFFWERRPSSGGRSRIR